MSEFSAFESDTEVVDEVGVPCVRSSTNESPWHFELDHGLSDRILLSQISI